MNPKALIINGGYLIRHIAVEKSKLSIRADFNMTSPLEIIGAPEGTSSLLINGKETPYTKSKLGNWLVSPAVAIPKVKVPDLKSLDWKYIDSLPEIRKEYDDAKWPNADLKETFNSKWPLNNSVSLYGGDYGFHSGAMLFRGHFTADGSEEKFTFWAFGGMGYGSSVWLDDQHLGSVVGEGPRNNHTSTYKLPNVQKGKKYVVTVIIDNMGLNGNWVPGQEVGKEPRGILDWSIKSASGKETKISKWKITGNLGGEDYIDKFRGPRNEGGFFFERQGYHLPAAPSKNFKSGSPFKGISKPGVAFYTAKLNLNLPSDKYDIPLSFEFKNNTASTGSYRAFLYVNGFQYGRYTSNIGPQSSFPVPEGVFNYRGENWIGIGLWALEKGANIEGLNLKIGQPVQTGRDPVSYVKAPKYAPRRGAY